MPSQLAGCQSSRLLRGGSSICTPPLRTPCYFRTTCRRSCSAVRAMAKKKEDDSPYKNTVNLPQTKFNMRANSKQREPEIQKFWAKERVYECLSRENRGEIYTLHDGPPYANGDLHCGHALNKVLKDIINRFQLLQGRRAKYIPGWDCHGLPIELKVLQGMKESERMQLDAIKLRRKARDFANKTVKSQKTQFQRFGVWADWETPYLTLDPAYEAAQLRVFAKMVAHGHIYRGRKPVHWSPSSQTALAEAELEYPDGHTSRSIYVAMPITSLPKGLSDDLKQQLQGAALAIWTTTPWTIPANAAVAVNADLKYCVAQSQDGDLKLILAEELSERLQGKFGKQLEILARFKGSTLEGIKYANPLSKQEPMLDRECPVVIGGDYITTEAGTGLVHTAPGHGHEDYQVGLKYGLSTIAPVDDAGVFTKEAGHLFQGKAVLDDGNTAVLEALVESGNLLKEERYEHRYPYDWRTKKPVIFRATEQWFASVEGFKQKALDAIGQVNWFPASGVARITSMTSSRSDWCISRQRKWGVPIPVFYHKESGEALMTQAVIEHVAGLVEEKGSDIWWLADIEALLPADLKPQASQYSKGLDTMDVWFDSGSSWASCTQQEGMNYPADLYLEGSDQHRGWFQSSLLTSVAVNGQAPYRNVLTHGFVLDERGMKMSKSIGNTQDPLTFVEGGQDQKKDPAYGADVLRLWVSSVDFQSDVAIGPNIIAQASEVYKKFRFTLRFLLGNLHDFDPNVDGVDFEALPLADRYMLHRLGRLLDDLQQSYSSFQFFKTYQALQRFAVQELSNFYLDIAKDRLYVSGAGSHERRSCQTVLAATARGLLAALAPILPHLAEDAWQSLPSTYTGIHKSVFLAGWQTPDPQWAAISDETVATASALKAIRDHVNIVLEKARQSKVLGSSLEGKVLLHVDDPSLSKNLKAWNQQPNTADPLRFMFIVSQAVMVEDSRDVSAACEHYESADLLQDGRLITAGVTRAEGKKCQRCWNYSSRVGEDLEHPALCERCSPIIRDMGFQLPASQSAVAA